MYRIYAQPTERLKQMLFARFGRHYGREFWALRDVTLSVRPGESVGVLGRNGSGKSTLLQLLAGTLGPSTGTLRVRGRVAALLELGSGFNLEFTGRENVLLNGAILGLSSAEVARRFDEIVAFADIGEFLDQPVKVYSSGMLMRLAFAVATTLDPDLLLVDEALAVGDVFFRQKCYLRLEALRARGVAIVLVSHAAHEVEQYCERALLLDHGHVLYSGPSVEAVKRYYLLEQQARAQAAGPRGPAPTRGTRALAELSQPGRAPVLAWPADTELDDVGAREQVTNGQARCLRVGLVDLEGLRLAAPAQGARAAFCCEFEVLDDLDVPVAGLMIHNERGVAVHGKHTLQYDCELPRHVPRGTRLRVRHEIALELSPQGYTYEVTLSHLSAEDYARRASFPHVDLYARIEQACVLTPAGGFTVTLRPVGSVPIQILHHGAANLPGRCALQALPPDAAMAEVGR
jgi:lipopolysaccharide transport system ATP-binding protein